MMLDGDVEARPWAEQQAIDDAAYREQVAYLTSARSSIAQSSRRRASLRRMLQAGSPRSPACP